VTHSIEEAVGLSDRVAVLSKSPGTVREVIDVRLPRPRTIGDVRNTPDFSLISHRVWELLQDKSAGAASAAVAPELDVGELIQPGTIL
jgi:NitT/TauT family transport system ATP-binding protein